MNEQETRFEAREDVLDAILASRQLQEDAWDAWFAVRDAHSDAYESARIRYMEANLEVNRLIDIDNLFRAGP